jgi:hypothetical protein
MDKPKEVLIKAVNNYLINRLSEFGFSFSESQLKITRKKGDFDNVIIFQGSKNNTSSQIVSFQENFLIYSSHYKKWKGKNFPDLVIGGGYIFPDRDEYWKNYNHDRVLQPSFGYDFQNIDHKLIMNDIYNNIINVALPYFDSNDSWDKVATNTNKDGIQKVDALIISNRIKEAKEKCESIIEAFEKFYGDSISGQALQIVTYCKSRKEWINNELIS